jgi:hypothetical protein
MNKTEDAVDRWSRELETKIREAVRQIRYGTVTLVIQDGHIVQIDKSEKIRLKCVPDASER